MILLKLKNENKLEEILKILKEEEYELSTKKSLWDKFLNFLGLYKKEENISFEERVTDSYIERHPHDDRYKNLPLSVLRTLKEKTFTLNPDVFDWDKISELNLSSSFMDRNFELLNKDTLSNKQLPQDFIIKRYEELDIKKVLTINNMIDLYINLYEKSLTEKLTEEEISFINYLNVWDIVFEYSKDLYEMNRRDVADNLIYRRSWASEVQNYEEEQEQD